jgi:predicted nucleotidyltransferase
MDLLHKLDDELIALYRTISIVSKRLGIPFLVVGASSRDLIFYHSHGLRIQRATKDVDFGIQVPSWEFFEKVKKELIAEGFRESKNAHRLIRGDIYPIDIVPFGEISNADLNIEWPPAGDNVMNVLGFQEAFEYSNLIRVGKEPDICMPVATPAGLTLMKLIAWRDRDRTLRKKDALDLKYIFESYERLPDSQTRVFEDTDLLEKYDADIMLIGAYLLGKDTNSIASDRSKEFVAKIWSTNESEEILAVEMSARASDAIEYSYSLLSAFKQGFME